ncbi:unnamed protein product [Paramecium sonneborni]|uniref:Uncharacterized protein n=1 Tax=Paramecium sonneborni TaxID=65129 RepID=A0A8S1N770_9CILI|nr:unnamed protein product [Paramecium sonneborni]
MQDQQLLIKVISVGDTQSGKSCLIKRFCEGRFINKYVTTIGVDYGVKKMMIQNKKVAINFFDLSGDEDYKEIRNPFFADAQGVVLVCDLTDRSSFQNLPKWEKMMVDNGLDLKQAAVYVVGNKSDLKNKEVDSGDILAYAKKKGFEGMICSAAGGENVNELFERMFAKIVDQIESQKSRIKC